MSAALLDRIQRQDLQLAQAAARIRALEATVADLEHSRTLEKLRACVHSLQERGEDVERLRTLAATLESEIAECPAAGFHDGYAYREEVEA